jgi:hypothetical protein
MLRARVRLTSIFALLMACSAPALAGPAEPAVDPVGARVRGATPSMQRMIDTGIRRSATFASLVAALNRTNVIVYVQETRDLPAGVDGQLAVSTSKTTQRYLRAQVLTGLGTSEMMVVIAHELQHALEVAAHQEVRDSKTLGELYRKIGVEARRGRYDTLAAQATSVRVRIELS